MISGFSVLKDPRDCCSVLFYAMTPNSDIYEQHYFDRPATLVGNFWGAGGPTPAQQESWGAMKSRYRGERGAPSAAQGK